MSYRTVTAARALLLAGAATLAVMPLPAFAQDQEQVAAEENAALGEAAEESGEIVVTARRRAEALQDVPIAVTAYSGEQLEREGAIDITDIGDTTPNVTLENSRATNSTLTAFIRGVGQQDPVAGFEQGVGIYLDDVYLNRPQGAVLDIYDVERIEVLRGPQGTLYGRNTIGGAVKYVTRRLPDDPEVKIRASVGTYGQADLIISAGGALTEGFRVGASAARLSRGGFGENITTGDENYNKDIWAVRGTIEMEPTDAISLRLSADYTWDGSEVRGGDRLIPSLCDAPCGQPAFPVLDDEFDTRGALVDPKQEVKGGGLAGHLTIDLADGFTLKSITAYRANRSSTPIDFDALPAIDVDVPAKYEDSQFSQEVQLEIDRGPLAGIVGAYYLDANANNIFDVRLYTTGPLLGLPGLTAVTQGDVDTKTWAIFGDFSYDITDQWSVSVGGRYTSDKRHAKVFRANYYLGGQAGLGGDAGFGTGIQVGAPTSDFDGKRKDTAFTPRASISFKPNDNHNIYLSYSRGFKGGGFDPRGLTTATPRSDPLVPPTAEEIYEFMAFEPETVDSYELGWKGALFDKRLRMAVALFRANYKDVQIPGSAGGVTAGGVPTFIGITTNAGKARFQGVEVEANWAVAEDLAAAGDRLNLSGSLGYLDAEYREFITVVNRDENGVRLQPLGTVAEVDLADFREVQNTPKWTLSGSLNYDTPLASGRLNFNSTLSYRGKSQQFEVAVPGIDQDGFALLDASIVWRSAGDRWSIGLHGKNLTDTRYITSGYNFMLQNPYTGDLILPNGQPGLSPALGREGILSNFYGNPRQVFVSFGAKF